MKGCHFLDENCEVIHQYEILLVKKSVESDVVDCIFVVDINHGFFSWQKSKYLSPPSDDYFQGYSFSRAAGSSRQVEDRVLRRT